MEIQNTKMEMQKTEIAKVKQQLQVTQVAFSATLLTEGQTTLGPCNAHFTLVFKHVLTNIGNAYNKHTGIFIAPVKGAYHFEWHILGLGTTPTGAALVKNSEHISLAYGYQKVDYNPSASGGVSLVLEAGDRVFVRLWAGTLIHDTENRHNTFSGHLLFTM
ncbi:cerebellin-2-like [Pholidichthys leucotaenia]